MTDVTINATVEATGPAVDVVTVPAPPGLPLGGVAHQILRKSTNTDYDSEWHTLIAADIGAVDILAVGAPNGVAALDAAGLVPAAQLPPSAFDLVTSVQGRIGDVVLTAADVGALTQVLGDARYALDDAVVHTAGGSVVAGPVGTVGLVINGDSTTDLQRWHTPDSGMLAYINGVGLNVDNDFAPNRWAQVVAGRVAVNTENYGASVLDPVQGNQFFADTANVVPIIVYGAPAHTANLAEFRNWDTNAVMASIGADGRAQFPGATIPSLVPTAVPLVLQAAVAQSADMTQWKNSAGTVLAKVNSAGLVQGARLAAISSDTTLVPMTVRAAASQATNMQEWQDSTGAALASVSSAGYQSSQGGFSNGTFTMQSAAASGVALIAKGRASQTADLQQWQNSTGSVVASVGPSGKLGVGSAPIASFSVVGSQFGDQVHAIIRGSSTQTADLQQWQSSTGTVIAKINSTGMWMNSDRMVVGSTGTDPGATLNAVARTASEVGFRARAAASPTANLLELQDSTGAVQVFATAGGNLALQSRAFVGGTGIDFNAFLNVATTSATRQAIVARGAASQSANLQEWQNSTGQVLARVDAFGNMAVAGNSALGGSSLSVTTNGTITQVGVIVRGAASQSADLQQWQDNSGTVRASVGAGGTVNSFYGSWTEPNGAAGVAAVIKAKASQTGDLTQWQDSTGTMQSRVLASGAHELVPTTTSSALRVGGTNAGNIGTISAMLFNPNFTMPTDSGSAFFPLAANFTPAYNSALSKSGGGSFFGGMFLNPNINGAGGIETKGLDVVTQINAGATLPTNRHIHVRTPTVGTGAITTNYGIQIDDQGPTGVTTGYQIFSIGRQSLFQAGAASVIPMVVRGAASQTADLQQWQDSTGQVQARINPFGSLAVGAGQAPAGRLTVGVASPGTIGIVTKAAAAQVADLQQWQDSNGTVLGSVLSDGTAHNNVMMRANRLLAGSNFSTTQLARITTYSNAATDLGVVIRGFTAQSADLTQWQDSTAAVIARMDASGILTAFRMQTPANTAGARMLEENSGGVLSLGKATAASAALAGGVKVYVRDGTNAGTLKLVAIGPGGVQATILDNVA